MSGGIDNPFLAVLYVDDIALMHSQQDDGDESGLQVSSSLASDGVRIFGLGELGEPPILSRSKSSTWNVNLTFLGLDINTHTDRISLPFEKNPKTERLTRIMAIIPGAGLRERRAQSYCEAMKHYFRLWCRKVFSLAGPGIKRLG